MLAPSRQPLATIFEEQFRGMALTPVTVNELEQTRETMISLIRTKLTEHQRRFLLSFKRGEPDWGLLNLSNVAELPAVQWKLQNVRRMASANVIRRSNVCGVCCTDNSMSEYLHTVRRTWEHATFPSASAGVRLVYPS